MQNTLCNKFLISKQGRHKVQQHLHIQHVNRVKDAQTGSNTTGQRKTVHSPNRIKWRLLLDTLWIQSAATRFQSASPFSVVTFPGHRPSPHIDTNPVRRPENLLCPLTHSEDGEWQATSGRSLQNSSAATAAAAVASGIFFHSAGVTGRHPLCGTALNFSQSITRM